MTESVFITDGYASLRLTKIGDADREYPPEFYPVRIDVVCGPLSASANAVTFPLSDFIADLQSAWNAMDGNAVLRFSNDAHTISITGNGEVSIDLVDGLHGRLSIQMQLDQSYLPHIQRDIERLFGRR